MTTALLVRIGDYAAEQASAYRDASTNIWLPLSRKARRVFVETLVATSRLFLPAATGCGATEDDHVRLIFNRRSHSLFLYGDQIFLQLAVLRRPMAPITDSSGPNTDAMNCRADLATPPS